MYASTRTLAISAILTAAFVESAVAAESSLASINNIFAFGDSWTSNGYSPAKGLQNIDLSNTTSGGDNWLKYFATNFTSATNSYYDFASVGAVIDNDVVFSNPATDFGSQVGLFETYVSNSNRSNPAPWLANDTLFAIWFGNDDLYNCFTNNQNFEAIIPRLLTAYDSAIGRLYLAGARKFLYISLPALSRSPLALSSQNASSTIANSVESWNSQLESYVSSTSTKYQGMDTTWFDAKSFTEKLLNKPSQYGFSNSTSSCQAYDSIIDSPDANDPNCEGPLETYFWKSSWNPTWPVHRLLASSIASTIENSTSGSPAEMSSASMSRQLRPNLAYPLLLIITLGMAWN